jgi:hypothetical protein
LDIKITPEDYKKSSDTLEKIIKFAQLHKKNRIAKKINSTALVCRGR